MFAVKSIAARSLRAATLFSILAFSQASQAQETLYAYGPGGPAPAMKEAAAEFEKTTGVKVEVTAGPTGKWLDKAKTDADLVFSGSETMMTDFVFAMDGQLSHQQVTPLYLRPLAMLVRPGNPKHIKSVKDLFKPGLKVLVVNGAGQNGVWEDMAGRKGDIRTVTALRNNIVGYAKNSAEAKQSWTENKDIDVWLIWNIWQVANPQLADVVPIERDYAIYRDSGIAITSRAENKPAAKEFVSYLQSPAGARIFAKWGWKTGQK
ncbi:extracellular solute-binding protein [Sulfuriferula thiophila]|uniref:extracellular solute-binding protein n=1 Tax=Sulfuriferula thiophila TaxID=1781211 RepID=UPI000F605FD2|nr:extracellular solute-binding protein [Sulfuriferula thiophila]